MKLLKWNELQNTTARSERTNGRYGVMEQWKKGKNTIEK